MGQRIAREMPRITIAQHPRRICTRSVWPIIYLARVDASAETGLAEAPWCFLCTRARAQATLPLPHSPSRGGSGSDADAVGNPRVFFLYPYPYPPKPLPVVRGKGTRLNR